MQSRLTIQDILKSPCGHLNKSLEDDTVKKVKKAKYRNKKAIYEDQVFDSIRERDRYIELLRVMKAGAIGQLRRQVEYELNPGGTYSYIYRADFVYVDVVHGEITEDSKGFRTREYLKKKRLMKKVHGITIKET